MNEKPRTAAAVKAWATIRARKAAASGNAAKIAAGQAVAHYNQVKAAKAKLAGAALDAYFIARADGADHKAALAGAA